MGTRLEGLKEATAVDQLPKESLDQLERVVLDERIDLFEEVVKQAAEAVTEQIGNRARDLLKPAVHLLEDAANSPGRTTEDLPSSCGHAKKARSMVGQTR